MSPTLACERSWVGCWLCGGVLFKFIKMSLKSHGREMEHTQMVLHTVLRTASQRTIIPFGYCISHSTVKGTIPPHDGRNHDFSIHLATQACQEASNHTNPIQLHDSKLPNNHTSPSKHKSSSCQCFQL
jgi:hypothetical protein